MDVKGRYQCYFGSLVITNEKIFMRYLIYFVFMGRLTQFSKSLKQLKPGLQLKLNHEGMVFLVSKCRYDLGLVAQALLKKIRPNNFVQVTMATKHRNITQFW